MKQKVAIARAVLHEPAADLPGRADQRARSGVGARRPRPSSATCATPAGRSSSAPTTWTRRAASATGSRSSGAVSCAWGRRATWSARCWGGELAIRPGRAGRALRAVVGSLPTVRDVEVAEWRRCSCSLDDARPRRAIAGAGAGSGRCRDPARRRVGLGAGGRVPVDRRRAAGQASPSRTTADGPRAGRARPRSSTTSGAAA